MLEILALIYLTRHIGEIIEEKGRKPIGYKLLTVGLWFGGEILMAIVGAVIAQVAGLPPLIAYVFALAGAAIGAGIAFLIAKSVSPTELAPPPGPPSFNRPGTGGSLGLGG